MNKYQLLRPRKLKTHYAALLVSSILIGSYAAIEQVKALSLQVIEQEVPVITASINTNSDTKEEVKGTRKKKQQKKQQPAQTTTTSSASQAPNVLESTSPTTVARSNTLSGWRFYVAPYGSAINQYNAWKKKRPSDAKHIHKIASQPIGQWIGFWASGNYVRAKTQEAAASNTAPIWVVYGLPATACGNTSAAQTYKNWINNVSAAIGGTRAILIIEPDALALTSCSNAAHQTARHALIKYAVDRFSAHNHGAATYIDAGHGNWVDAHTMAKKLNSVGIKKAQGFALNVSNFTTNSSNIAYGNRLSSLTGNSRYVIDTSRNGRGSNGEWCNPLGRALGVKPTTNTGQALVDAYLWIKYPGESDGTCNGGPSEGKWWPNYALGLVKRAAY